MFKYDSYLHQTDMETEGWRVWVIFLGPTNNEGPAKTLTQVMLTTDSKLLNIILENKDDHYHNFFAKL